MAQKYNAAHIDAMIDAGLDTLLALVKAKAREFLDVPQSAKEEEADFDLYRGELAMLMYSRYCRAVYKEDPQWSCLTPTTREVWRTIADEAFTFFKEKVEA